MITNFRSKLLKSQNSINSKIFFLHIPKCGGSSLKAAIQDKLRFSDQQAREVFHLDSAAALKTSQTANEPPLILKRKMLYYCMASQKYKYIGGHFCYSEDAMRDFGDKWNFITILRDPVSKWFSQYFFNRHKPGDHYKLNCDLKTFLESTNAINLGRNYVSLLVDSIDKEEASSEKAVELAISNLKKFSLVGILEDLDSFLTAFERQFGPKLRIEKRNKNPLSKQQQNQQITEDIRKQVEELCQPNMRVYKAALEMLEGKSEGIGTHKNF